jgi:hypothetical protein
VRKYLAVNFSSRESVSVSSVHQPGQTSTPEGALMAVRTVEHRWQRRGDGTVNGVGGYGFVAYAYDDPDSIRLVVWSLADGPYPGAKTLYDNSRKSHYDLDLAEPQPLSAGSVQVHEWGARRARLKPEEGGWRSLSVTLPRSRT